MDFYVFYNKPSAIQNKAQTLYSLVELDKIYYNTFFHEFAQHDLNANSTSGIFYTDFLFF